MKILLLEENRTNPKVNSNYSTDFPMFLLNLKCYLPEGEHLGEENQLDFCCPTYEHQTHVVYRQLTRLNLIPFALEERGKKRISRHFSIHTMNLFGLWPIPEN